MSRKVTEDDIQAVVVEYCDLNNIPVFAIPNAQRLSFLDRKAAMIAMAKMKKTGLKSGVPDLFIPIALHGYHGMFIELKTAKGVLTDNQKEWLKLLHDNGYYTVVAKGVNQALKEIEKYTKQI